MGYISPFYVSTYNSKIWEKGSQLEKTWFRFIAQSYMDMLQKWEHPVLALQMELTKFPLIHCFHGIHNGVAMCGQSLSVMWLKKHNTGFFCFQKTIQSEAEDGLVTQEIQTKVSSIWFKVRSHSAFLLSATASPLVQQMGCTGLNVSVHTMRLRQNHQLLCHPL